MDGWCQTMFYVYMLETTTDAGMKSLYVGSTNSLNRRFSEHVAGQGAQFTKNKQLKLVFYQSFRTRSEAMLKEQQLKKMPRLKKKALIADILENEFLIED